MLDCHTILCVYNQMPSFGWDDLFIVGYLGIGMTVVVYLMIEAWKGD